MQHIRAGQIKAARAFLDWSQEDLAIVTGLSLTTIRNLEMGYISPRNATTHVVRQAIENAGLEFIG
jgi:predicted transcriptional regulator